MLFEAKERTVPGPMGELEGDWEYLDRSGRPEATNVRDFLEHWVSEYPATHRAQLAARMRSGKRDAYEAATFELIVYALLRSLGCSVDIEPGLPNGSAKRPDFLAVTPEGESVYVEATLASAYSKAEMAAKNRVKRVYAAMEKLDCPDFAINVRVRRQSLQSVNERELRHFLKGWIASLNPDQIVQQIIAHQLAGAPRTRWDNNGWTIEFEAMARKPERRGLGQRVVGVRWGNVQTVNDWQPIRDAIKRKGSRYGLLPHPFLVAINVDAFSMDQSDEVQAFFGQEEIVFNTLDGLSSPTVRLRPDGVWVRQFTRVSGAWMFSRMGLWTIASRDSTAYFNPWAAKPLPELFTRLHHAKAVEEQLQWTKGVLPRELLSLPPAWP